MATTAVQFAGRPFRLGGTSYVVPPLSIRGVKENREKVLRIQAGKDPLQEPALFDDMLDVIHAAIARNYPMERAALEDLVDIANVVDLFQTVCAVSGFEPVAGTEGNGSGEAASPTSSSGTPSTSS